MSVARNLSLDNDKKTFQAYNYIKITVNGKELALNIDNGIVFPVKDVNLEIHSNVGQKISSLKLNELNKEKTNLFASMNENTKIKFYFPENNATTTLPKEMNTNLVNFFKKYKPAHKKDYCCINFAYEMAYGRGFIKDDNCIDYFHQNDPNMFNEDQLSPGDIVYLYKDSKSRSPFHFAINISQYYFLSLFGTSGPLIVTSLDAMKRGFGAETCVQVTNIQNINTNDRNVFNIKNRNHSKGSVVKDGIFSPSIAAMELNNNAASSPSQRL